jgi:DNA uptake protein ComE-like DNA-binding protein
MTRLALLVPAALLIACGDRTDTAADSAGATSQASGNVTGTTTGSTTGAAIAASSLMDPNTATREQLVSAGVDTATVAVIMAGRPFSDMLAVDKALTPKMNADQRKALYAKVWRPIDLNKATGPEILLIPGVGNRMKHEFEEYRPYTSIEQFRREIGKYVDKTEVARLEQYVSIKP